MKTNIKIFTVLMLALTTMPGLAQESISFEHNPENAVDSDLPELTVTATRQKGTERASGLDTSQVRASDISVNKSTSSLDNIQIKNPQNGNTETISFDPSDKDAKKTFLNDLATKYNAIHNAGAFPLNNESALSWGNNNFANGTVFDKIYDYSKILCEKNISKNGIAQTTFSKQGSRFTCKIKTCDANHIPAPNRQNPKNCVSKPTQSTSNTQNTSQVKEYKSDADALIRRIQESYKNNIINQVITYPDLTQYNGSDQIRINDTLKTWKEKCTAANGETETSTNNGNTTLKCVQKQVPQAQTEPSATIDSDKQCPTPHTVYDESTKTCKYKKQGPFPKSNCYVGSFYIYTNMSGQQKEDNENEFKEWQAACKNLAECKHAKEMTWEQQNTGNDYINYGCIPKTCLPDFPDKKESGCEEETNVTDDIEVILNAFKQKAKQLKKQECAKKCEPQNNAG